MLVCALPRCGATRYCLDRAEELGLPFIGELNPMHIKELGEVNVKQLHHETSYQPQYTIDTYLDALINTDKYVVLVNHSPHLVIDKADVVVLRRDMRNAFLSYASFLLVTRPYLTCEGVIQHVHLAFHSYYGVRHYLNKYNKSVVWYEEYFDKTDTNTQRLDEYKHGKSIIRHIDGLLKRCNN